MKFESKDKGRYISKFDGVVSMVFGVGEISLIICEIPKDILQNKVKCINANRR